MKRTIRLSSIALVAISLFLFACKKDKTDGQDDDSSGQMEQSADELLMQNESENALNEVNAAISGSTFGKTVGIAGATINDSSFISEKKVIITYNGTSADGRRNRTGEITIQLINGNNWGEQGSVVKIDFNNFRITQIASGKSIVLNGFHAITNTSGGRSFVSASVTHTIRGSVKVSFDNATSRSWQIARKRVVTSTSGVYEITVTGDTTLSATQHIAVWGTNRQGNSFYTQISQPVVWSSTCPAGPLSGVKVHKGIAREITVTFGVDASGNPVTGTCAYGFKINWINLRNQSKTTVISY
jgi:hypothetical protein